MKIAIRQKIISRLKEVEKENNIEILIAVESGSRTWGFESTDSDYDVRFIYKNQKDWYLKIKPERDVIEYPIVDEFDYSGWDLRKTLLLLDKSNPVLMEWMNSTIVYIKNEYFYSNFTKLVDEYFNPISSTHHYLTWQKVHSKKFAKAIKPN